MAALSKCWKRAPVFELHQAHSRVRLRRRGRGASSSMNAGAEDCGVEEGRAGSDAWSEREWCKAEATAAT